MGGEIVMNLKCISRLSFKNANNTLEDDIKNSPYTSYFWWHGTPPPPSAIIDGGGINLQNCGLFFNLGRNISFRPIFTIDFLYNCISTASYGVTISFSEYTKSTYKKLYYYDGTLFTFPTTQPLVSNKYRRYTWSSDGKTYRLFFDGKQVASGNYISDKIGFYLNAHDPDHGGGYAVGVLKYVALYALPVTEDFNADEEFTDYYRIYANNNNAYSI